MYSEITCTCRFLHSKNRIGKYGQYFTERKALTKPTSNEYYLQLRVHYADSSSTARDDIIRRAKTSFATHRLSSRIQLHARVRPPTTAEILSILGEERDKQERASNFVLHGLAEGAGATDREEVLKLFPHLAEATEIFRLGRVAPSPTSKSRPLLVKTTRPYKSEAFRAKN